MVRPWVIAVNGFITLCAILGTNASAGEIKTNFIHFKNAPPWLKESLVEKATGPVQDFLQWDIRRIQAFYHPEAASFQALHGMGPSVRAFFRRSDSTLHLGPAVNEKNFQPIFSHELVHAIFFQKYKTAIPKWIEEGLANYLGKIGPVDYAWLSTQPFVNVTALAHPSSDPTGLRFHYQTSQAVTEMIASKCSLSDLLQLSVGKKMETYLKTYCEIPDVNEAYKAWVEVASRRSQRPSKAARPTNGPVQKYKPLQKRQEEAS